LLDALASLSVAQSRQGDTRQARALVEEASAIARRNKSFPKLYTARLDEAQQLIR
jgi:hypothetical protein